MSILISHYARLYIIPFIEVAHINGKIIISLNSKGQYYFG